MLKNILCAFIVAAAMIGAAVAAPYEDGVAAYNRGAYGTAVKIWTRAAERGNAAAQNALGVMYTQGQGVRQDHARAAKWYQRAAGQGLGFAQGNLAAMYFKGDAVPQNYVLAHMWFSLAAARGNEAAAKYLDDTVKLMTADEITEAQRLAREWKPRPEG